MGRQRLPGVLDGVVWSESSNGGKGSSLYGGGFGRPGNGALRRLALTPPYAAALCLWAAQTLKQASTALCACGVTGSSDGGYTAGSPAGTCSCGSSDGSYTAGSPAGTCSCGSGRARQHRLQDGVAMKTRQAPPCSPTAPCPTKPHARAGPGESRRPIYSLFKHKWTYAVLAGFINFMIPFVGACLACEATRLGASCAD